MRKIILLVFCLSFFMPLGALAYNPADDDLVKSADFASVYLVKNSLRYSFPSQKTYQAYYGNDFSKVKTISTAELAQLPLKGNVLLPDASLVKIISMPNVYKVITKNGAKSLEWIPSEQEAISSFGTNWSAKVIDLPDVFFIDYQIVSASIAPNLTSSSNISSEIKSNNGFLGEGNSAIKSICYCDNGYESASSNKYNVAIESPDNDKDGIANQYDLHPNGGDVIKNKILTYNDYENNIQYNFQIDIPYDWYHYYVYYQTHNFTSNYANIADFVTPDAPPIRQLAEKFVKAGQENSNFNYVNAALYIVQHNFYLHDSNAGIFEYPKYPLETIMEGTADCEDNSFLMASILKAYLKLTDLNNTDNKVALIRFSNHVAVGWGFGPAFYQAYLDKMTKQNKTWNPNYFTLNNIKYYFIETTLIGYNLGDTPANLINQTVTIHPLE